MQSPAETTFLMEGQRPDPKLNQAHSISVIQEKEQKMDGAQFLCLVMQCPFVTFLKGQ